MSILQNRNEEGRVALPGLRRDERVKAFCSWSGGKESAYALHKAQRQGMEVSFLLNMVSEDGKRSRSHGVPAELLIKQADGIGIPIIQAGCWWNDYEKKFKNAVSSMNGIEAGIFGDIDIQEHRDWVERVCNELGIMPILPLWKEKREEFLHTFINDGFKAVVVAAKDNSLIGRRINEQFITDLKSMDDIDLCGERGEYHTFVFDGPIFKRPVKMSSDKSCLYDDNLKGVR